MAKGQNIEVIGEVLQELGNGMFKVYLTDSGAEILCTISGKIRKNYIRIMVGDKVKVDISPYDLTRGRIERRIDNNEVSVNKSTNSKNKKKK